MSERSTQMHERSKEPKSKNQNQQSGFMDASYTENVQFFRDFIVQRAMEPDKRDHERLFENSFNQVTNPDMQRIMNKYHNDSSNAGVFTNKENLLTKTMIELYRVNYIPFTGEAFADKLTSDPKFKDWVKDEAKNLLSGTTIYSTQVASMELKGLRGSLAIQHGEIQELNTKNERLAGSVATLTNKLSNLVSNLKNVLGLSGQAIDAYTEKEYHKMLQENERQNKFEMIGSYTIVPTDQGNYPAGVGESDELYLYKVADNTYTLKNISNDLDGSFDGARVEGIKGDQLYDMVKGHIHFESSKVSFSSFDGDPSKRISSPEELKAHIQNLIPTKQNVDIKHKL